MKRFGLERQRNREASVSVRTTGKYSPGGKYHTNAGCFRWEHKYGRRRRANYIHKRSQTTSFASRLYLRNRCGTAQAIAQCLENSGAVMRSLSKQAVPGHLSQSDPTVGQSHTGTFSQASFCR